MSDISLSVSNSDESKVEKTEEDENESIIIDGPNPYEEFNPIFINDSFLKSSTILQFLSNLNVLTVDKLSSITDREDFVKYVEAIFRHLRFNPQKFIFFLSKPEPSDKDEKEVILIRSDRKVLCIRKNSTYLLKGHVAHIFFKNKSRIQITMSKGLFIKFTVWKELNNLKSVIPDFLNLSENPRFYSAEDLFFKSLMDLPNNFSDLNHILKNSFLSLFLTSNLEFCRKLAFCKFKDENIFKVSQDIMFIFQKAHLWDHLMRALIPLYINKQVEDVKTIMIDYKINFVPCLLNICRLHYGQKFLPQVSKILFPIVCQSSIDEDSISTFIKLVLNMNFPSQILLIAKELYKAVKDKFPDDENAAALVIGKFLITDFIFPELLNNITEKSEKRQYYIYLGILTLNKQFKEGAHFIKVIRKLYISLGENEINVPNVTSTEKAVFSYHISHLFSYFQENASSLYNQFLYIDLSHEKSPVYCEIMKLFEYIDLIKKGEKIGLADNYIDKLIIHLDNIELRIKKGQIKIKRTNKKDVKHIVKSQKDEKKKLIAELKEKKAEERKKVKLEKKNAKKLEKSKKSGLKEINENSESSQNDKSEKEGADDADPKTAINDDDDAKSEEGEIDAEIEGDELGGDFGSEAKDKDESEIGGYGESDALFDAEPKDDDDEPKVEGIDDDEAKIEGDELGGDFGSEAKDKDEVKIGDGGDELGAAFDAEPKGDDDEPKVEGIDEAKIGGDELGGDFGAGAKDRDEVEIGDGGELDAHFDAEPKGHDGGEAKIEGAEIDAIDDDGATIPVPPPDAVADPTIDPDADLAGTAEPEAETNVDHDTEPAAIEAEKVATEPANKKEKKKLFGGLFKKKGK